MTYEEIGKLAAVWFVAEESRIAARIERAKQRDAHKCVVEREYYEDDTGASEHFCYNQHVRNPTPFVEWCDNCKYVQRYHLAYVAAARKARTARANLTRRIKRRLLKLENRSFREHTRQSK